MSYNLERREYNPRENCPFLAQRNEFVLVFFNTIPYVDFLYIQFHKSTLFGHTITKPTPATDFKGRSPSLGARICSKVSQSIDIWLL